MLTWDRLPACRAEVGWKPARPKATTQGEHTMIRIERRDFLAGSLGLVAGGVLLADDKKAPWFKISLAQWSLHRAFFGRTKPQLDPLDFAKIAKDDYGIDAIEYVNQFYK